MTEAEALKRVLFFAECHVVTLCCAPRKEANAALEVARAAVAAWEAQRDREGQRGRRDADDRDVVVRAA